MGRATIDQSEDRSALHVPVGSKTESSQYEQMFSELPLQSGHWSGLARPQPTANFTALHGGE